MTHASTDADIDPDALFVIACPICFGQVAAVAQMAGTAACCPLCAGSFLVPRAKLAAALAPTPAPVSPSSVSPATPAETSTAAPLAAPAAPVLPSPESTPAVTPLGPEPSVAPVATSAVTPPARLDNASPPTESSTSTPSSAPPAFGHVPVIQASVADATTPIAHLQFHDPVKTVGVGAARIELRRLTDEERRIRRSRRNIMLLLVGAAVLIMIVVMLGIPAQRR
ncbi:MAG: hypothetical protein ACKOC8_06095 [Pirellulales bacterium]